MNGSNQGDQLPFKNGQPWSRADVPVGKGASQFDDLDVELTDEEIEECMVDDLFFPIEVGEYPIEVGEYFPDDV